MAFDSFLKLEGVTGEATAKGFEGTMEVYSFSWGASNPAVMSGTGLGAGKVSVSSFNMMKKSDKSSPILFQSVCTGKHFKSATFSMRKAGGEQIEFLKYEFTTVMIESIQWSGSSGGDDTPTESLSFAFEKVDISYMPQAGTGSTEGKVAGGWDLKTVAVK